MARLSHLSDEPTYGKLTATDTGETLIGAEGPHLQATKRSSPPG